MTHLNIDGYHKILKKTHFLVIGKAAEIVAETRSFLIKIVSELMPNNVNALSACHSMQCSIAMKWKILWNKVIR